ncbi:hypothetical protein PVAP13_2NG167309 [Panicum virgatum]|uniref:Uncharacterized protein n=1 Tax=Panicum virgatum TaxID=38727 RepID=A0A8T0VIM4_PANVG|nr:hypothetical protein PVAP13_2NG167309 [Panicum virgatum]
MAASLSSLAWTPVMVAPWICAFSMSWRRVLRLTSYWCTSSNLSRRLVENCWRSCFMMVAVEAMGARRIELVSGFQCNKRDREVVAAAAALRFRAAAAVGEKEGAAVLGQRERRGGQCSERKEREEISVSAITFLISMITWS